MFLIHKLSSEAQLTFVLQCLKIMFGMSLEDVRKATMCIPTKMLYKSLQGPLNKSSTLVSHLSHLTKKANTYEQGQKCLSTKCANKMCPFGAKTI